MEITDRIGNLRDGVHGRRLEGKLNDAQRENVRWKTEARVLRDEVRDDHGDLSKVLSAIEQSNARQPRHRLRRIVTLVAAAAGAYVMGAKAGRQRYDEISAAWHKMVRNGRSAAGDIQEGVDGLVEEAQSAGGRMSDAGQVIGETMHAVAKGPQDPDGGSTAANTSRSV